MESNPVTCSDIASKVDPAHYTSRPVECINFTRRMSFSCGNAFKYLWRLGAKDDAAIENGKIDWYIKDVIVNRQAPTITTSEADTLMRQLSLMHDTFPPDVFMVLVALIDSAAGDYELLLEVAKEREIFSAFMFGLLTERGQ